MPSLTEINGASNYRVLRTLFLSPLVSSIEVVMATDGNQAKLGMVFLRRAASVQVSRPGAASAVAMSLPMCEMFRPGFG